MLQHLKNETNYTQTTNGETTHKTSNSDLLDFFSTAGAARHWNEAQVISAFNKAYNENPAYALKALFYFRDVRGGQGERKLFRTIAKHLANTNPASLAPFVNLIPHYGRWDDLLSLFDTPLELSAIQVIAEQWNKDVASANAGESTSLMFKWLPSINASSEDTKAAARKILKAIQLTPVQYRKTLSNMRRFLDVVEVKMSAKEWSEINYAKLPSQASLKNRTAFFRNDEDRYRAFLDSIEKGEVKVNASTLYPYQLVEKVSYYRSSDESLLNAMWENLPDYIDGKDSNAIAVIDVSGSMSGTPMEVAVSLGMYMAERNKGAFHNHFITFSANPELVEIKGETFCDRVRNIKSSDWGYNTNLERVFLLLLNTAKRNKLPQSDLPSSLYVISDMQFDSAFSGSKNQTFFNKMKKLFEDNGYTLPKIIFWNVDAHHGQSPVLQNTENVQLVSGFSSSLFESLMKQNEYNPYEMMMAILDAERYQLISL